MGYFWLHTFLKSELFVKVYKTSGYKMFKNWMTGSMFQVSEKGSLHNWKNQMGMSTYASARKDFLWGIT